MVYIQRTNPPPNRMLTFSISQFNGGLNNTSALTAPNEANNVLNMTFYDNLVMEKRRGSTQYNEMSYSEDITHIGEFKPYTDPNQMIIGSVNKLTFHNGSTPFDVTLPGKGYDGENFQGRYFFVDGEKIRVYGRFPTATSTYVRIVGTASSAHRVMNVISTPTSYTPLDTSHVRGVTVYDFTNGNVWYEPCANEKADPYLGVSVVPTGVRYMASLRGRLYVSGSGSDNDNVFITQVGNPFYYPPSMPIQIPPNSDKVMGLIVYDDSVLVGRQYDIHNITGLTNNPELGLEMFRLNRLNTHTGFVNNKSASIAHNYLFFVGFDGNCYSLSSARDDAKVLSTTILTKNIGFKLPPFTLSDATIRTAVSIFHDGIWYVSMGSYVFVYNYLVRAWTAWDGLNVRSFYDKDGVLIWGNTSNKVCKFSTDYLDFGKPYLAFWQSGLHDMGDAISYKQFRDMFLVGHTFSGYDSDIRISFELDYVNMDGNLSVNNQVARWGVARFGDKYTPKPINPSQPFTIGQRARTIRIRFSNSYKLTGTVADKASLPTNIFHEDMYYATLEDRYYVRDKIANVWNEFTLNDLNQPMRVYQITGEYEMRGKR